jgi:hypothetical protein
MRLFGACAMPGLRRDDVETSVGFSNRGEAFPEAAVRLGVVNRQKEETMIKRLSQAGVPVLDQDSAKAFYTEKLASRCVPTRRWTASAG